MIAPGLATLGCQTISYVDPAGTFSPSVGLVIGLKPGVWAMTALAKAKRVAKEKRILPNLELVTQQRWIRKKKE